MRSFGRAQSPEGVLNATSLLRMHRAGSMSGWMGHGSYTGCYNYPPTLMTFSVCMVHGGRLWLTWEEGAVVNSKRFTEVGRDHKHLLKYFYGRRNVTSVWIFGILNTSAGGKHLATLQDNRTINHIWQHSHKNIVNIIYSRFFLTFAQGFSWFDNFYGSDKCRCKYFHVAMPIPSPHLFFIWQYTELNYY